MIRKTIVMILFTLFPLLSYSSDWQYWNTDSIEYQNIKLEGEFYVEDNDCYYKHVDIGYSDDIINWLEAGINYRYITENEKEENRIHGNLTLKEKILNLKISDRNRLEYRIKETDTAWRYRNRFRLEYPMLWISPYVDDEIFIPMTDSQSGTINQNRISAGLKIKLTSYASFKLYAMLISEKNDSDWDETNILGSEISVNF